MRFLSPLRYPGGKAALAAFIGELIASADPSPTRYIEPFAGGAGVGLRLLFDEYVEEVVLNDLDAGIAAFWRCVFYRTDELVERVRRTRPTLAEWHRQHEVYLTGSDNELDRAFATFFLNRTNHSGILPDARPIGGMRQRGVWRMNVRYNADALCERIERIGRYRNRVVVQQRDGIAIAREYVGKQGNFVYLDPPYIQKGAELYLDTLTLNDHARLARVLTQRTGWLLTYDVNRMVRTWYAGHRRAIFSIRHVAGRQHLGREYMLFAPGLKLPPLGLLGRGAVLTRNAA